MADDNELFNLICKLRSNMQVGFWKVYEEMDKLEEEITKSAEIIANIDVKVRLLVDGQVLFKE